MTSELPSIATDEFEQTIVSTSELETTRFARAFAVMLRPGDVVALRGELGAGKTFVVKVIAAALGYTGTVTSPTFTLLNVYATARWPIYHFDFYRIDSPEEASGIGVEEFLDGDGISLVEWPEKIAALLPGRFYDFHLQIVDFVTSPNTRKITIRKASA